MAYLVEENKTKWHITLLEEVMHHPHQGSVEQEKFTYVNGERPTPSIIPLYSCIDVHVCGEMKLQPVHVFHKDAGGANIGHVTTVSTDGKGEGGGGGGGGGEESNGTTTVWQIHPPPPSRIE